MSAAVALPEVQPPDIMAFIAGNGRFPFLSDPVKPWQYRGWLLAYVMEIQARHADVPDRWGYLARTLEAGRLLDEPIPQVHFGHADAQVLRSIEKWVDILSYRSGSSSALRDLLEWLAWGLAVSKEEPRLDSDIQEKLYREVNIGPMLLKPSDYLGTLLSETKVNKYNTTGFYPTPHEVVQLMVRMNMENGAELPDGRDQRLATVCDPCVGTGRMLLEASNYSMCLFGMDIDPMVCRISMINGAMYAPWLVRPLPASITDMRIPAPPAQIPVPEVYRLPDNVVPFRCDDAGQGLLFSDI